MKQILSPKIQDKAGDTLRAVGRYKVIVFISLIIGVYGYIVFTISMVSNAQPTADQISKETNPIKTTKIDPKIVQQLKQLQDNSVSVRALFDEARNNPFQEN